MFKEFDMHNYIDKPTHLNDIIDVVFSNISSNSTVVSDTHLSDHAF